VLDNLDAAAHQLDTEGKGGAFLLVNVMSRDQDEQTMLDNLEAAVRWTFPIY
jgi:hypothetical protein